MEEIKCSEGRRLVLTFYNFLIFIFIGVAFIITAPILAYYAWKYKKFPFAGMDTIDIFKFI